jgi:RNA polymerase sigma factor (sigma-70 family)
MQEKPELELILQALAAERRDETAWKDLYTLLWPFVLTTVFRRLRGLREVATDASQEVFLRIVHYCDFGRLQNPQVFRAYVRSMCINVSRTYLKQASKYGTDTDEIGLDDWKELASRFPLPDETAQVNEVLSDILGDLEDSAIDKLILSRVIQGFALPEIASECGLSYSATAVRLHRLRRRLSSYLSVKKNTSEV